MSERDPINKQPNESALTPSIRWPDGNASAVVIKSGHSVSHIPLTPEQIEQHSQSLIELLKDTNRNRIEAREAETNRGRLKAEINADHSLAPLQGN